MTIQPADYHTQSSAAAPWQRKKSSLRIDKRIMKYLRRRKSCIPSALKRKYADIVRISSNSQPYQDTVVRAAAEQQSILFLVQNIVQQLI